MVAASSRTSLVRASSAVADALVGPLLEKRQQLGLEGRRQVADLVEEQSASLGRRDLARRVADRTRERSANVAKQLALQQFGRQARAVDRDERSRSVRAAEVDGAGQDALAGAALAAQQDGRVARRRLEHHAERLLRGGVDRVQVGLRHRRLHLFFQVGHPSATACTGCQRSSSICS